MIAIIKNMENYNRELPLYGLNQYINLEPRDSLVIAEVNHTNEIFYYKSLKCQGFSVCFKKEKCL